MNIICLNGPPGSGKDTVGRMIQDKIGNRVKVDKFASPLDDIARTILNLNDITKYKEYQKWREIRKEETLLGYPTTMRKLLIAISEDLVKPQLGKEYFGLQAAKRVLDEYKYNKEYSTETFFQLKDVIVFTDSGFCYEYEIFLSHIDSQKLKIKTHLIQLHRPNCSFKNDSREWVTDNTKGHLVINNIDNLDYLNKEVDIVLQQIELF